MFFLFWPSIFDVRLFRLKPKRRKPTKTARSIIFIIVIKCRWIPVCACVCCCEYSGRPRTTRRGPYKYTKRFEKCDSPILRVFTSLTKSGRKIRGCTIVVFIHTLTFKKGFRSLKKQTFGNFISLKYFCYFLN